MKGYKKNPEEDKKSFLLRSSKIFKMLPNIPDFFGNSSLFVVIHIINLLKIEDFFARNSNFRPILEAISFLRSQQSVPKHLIKHIMDCTSIENLFITPAKLQEKIFVDFPTIEMGKYFRNCTTKTFTCPCGCIQTFQEFLYVTKIIKRDESFLKSIAKHYEPQGDSGFCPNCVGFVIGSSITRFNITSKFWVVSSNEEVEFSRTFSCSNGYKYKLIAIISEKILQEKVLYSFVYYNERASVYKVFADARCYEVENDIFEKRKGSRTAIYELEERPEEPDIYKYLSMEEFVSNTDKGYYEFLYTGV